MAYLSVITIVWAFSFSLIGVYLAGQVDPWFSVWTRVSLACVLFLPFLRFTQLSFKLAGQLMLIGAVQLGLMYAFYYQSFLYLTVPEVLLFTVMTPIYITLLNDLLEKQFNKTFFISAALATIGAIAIRFDTINAGFMTGFLIVQGANICFACGQVFYKRVLANHENLKQSQIFACFFIGAFITASICLILFGNLEKLPTTSTQWSILIYLGLVASGLGYFVWNKGATQVNVGLLAIMNNLLIPAGIAVNLLIWNRDADLVRLAIGAAIMLVALFVNEKFKNRIN